MTQERAVTHGEYGIWLSALGYFACYVPYAALTKVLSERGISGLALLPASAVASAAGMVLFFSLSGWWRHAGHRTIAGRSLPLPSGWTLLSGTCSALVIATTTLAYTFRGTSIVIMVLLMKGGVLLLAPIVDALSKKKVGPASWAGLALSLVALLVSMPRHGEGGLGAAAALDIGVYLACYFVRLRLMSELAKREGADARLRFFVEEHMVASPVLVAVLAVLAALGVPALRTGFSLFASPSIPGILLIGLLSEGTGIFGGLILVDPRENSFCVPLNRASSVLAGVLASLGLAAALGFAPPAAGELVGAGVLVLAIGVLALWPKGVARPAPGSSSESAVKPET